MAVQKIAAGGSHSLALKLDGTVVAWGRNYDGQCNVPTGLSDVKEISAGEYHSLALKSDGTVIAWGRNNDGQCNVPTGLSDVKEISAGWHHSLALKSDGTVVAWGYNEAGQCDVPEGLNGVTAISAGGYHSLALKSDGTVIAWGYNNDGAYNVPEGLSDVKEISAGGYYSLALKLDGAVIAWGRNDAGQCDVPSGLVATAIAAGWYHSLALKEDDTVIAWGYNDDGQCDVPEGLNDVKEISAGYAHSLALKSDGAVVAWGWNDDGQCDIPEGLNDAVVEQKIAARYKHSLALKPDGTVVAWGWNNDGQCDVPEGLNDVKEISAGYAHSLALKSDGAVVAWGRNDDGQCNVPVGLDSVIAISAGTRHSMALKSDGTVVTWGNSSYDVPEGLSDVIAISVGDQHFLALKSDGIVVAWGYNHYGQCDVPEGLVATAISAGTSYSMALKPDGTVVAWGGDYDYSDYGQYDVPVGLNNVTAISAGDSHSLALKFDGTVVCWGKNDCGQCNAPGLAATAIATGETYSLALKSDGTVTVWGDGSSGQYEMPIGLNPAPSQKTIASLPIGSKIKLGQYSVEGSSAQPIIWQIVGYNRYKGSNNLSISNHVTLVTEKLIDAKGFDASEPDNPGDSHCYYNVSNIRQWLNSTGVANSWYSPQHAYDMPPTYTGFGIELTCTNGHTFEGDICPTCGEPKDYTPTSVSYDNEDGFLHSNRFSENELGFIVPTKIEYRLGRAYYDDEGNYIDKGYSTDKVFLLSANEIAAEENSTGFSVFNSDEARKAYYTDQAINNSYYGGSWVTANPGYWWLRDFYWYSFSWRATIAEVNDSGQPYWGDEPYYAYKGIRPVTNITANVLVSDTPDADGCYTIIGFGDIFEWTYPKIAKQPLVGTLTYDEEARVLRLFLRGFSEEWAAFQIAINKKRTKYGLSNYAFTTIIAGTTRFGAGIFNEAITAINEIYTAKGETSQIMEEIRNGVQGRTQGVKWKTEADYFNNLRDALNNA